MTTLIHRPLRNDRSTVPILLSAHLFDLYRLPRRAIWPDTSFPNPVFNLHNNFPLLAPSTITFTPSPLTLSHNPPKPHCNTFLNFEYHLSRPWVSCYYHIPIARPQRLSSTLQRADGNQPSSTSITLQEHNLPKQLDS